MRRGAFSRSARRCRSGSRKSCFRKACSATISADIDDRIDWEAQLLFTDHHESHAACAFFPSPFAKSAILTLDGVGEWTTTSVGFGRDNTLDLTREIHFPHSLGLLYSAFTYYTGFKVNSGEYKVMGLAPYGEPNYAQTILEHLIDLKEDGSFRLDLDYFDYCTGLTMTNGGSTRCSAAAAQSGELLTSATWISPPPIQEVTEEIVLRLARSLARERPIGKSLPRRRRRAQLRRQRQASARRRFENIWIQPAAGDAGGALGAALAAYYQFAGQPRAGTNAMTP